LKFNGSGSSGLKTIYGLTTLTLDLTKSDVPSLSGLERYKQLTSLTLNLGESPDESKVASLAEVGQLGRLKTLDLRLAYTDVISLSGLEQLKALTTLTLDLNNHLGWFPPQVVPVLFLLSDTTVLRCMCRIPPHDTRLMVP
jgi:hypothetical protein